MRAIIAIDADSTKVGISFLNYDDGSLLYSDVITSSLSGFDRTYDLFKQFLTLMKSHMMIYKFCGCIFEDYGFYHVQRIANMKAELIGMMKYFLRAKNIPMFYYIGTQYKKKKKYTYECACAPTQLKQFIYGTGRAPKEGKSSKLMLEVFKLTGYEFENDDLADSYMLALVYYVYLYCAENRIKDYKKYQKKPATFVNKDNKTVELKLSAEKFKPIDKWLKGQG